MKTPDFWLKNGSIAGLLIPITVCYYLICTVYKWITNFSKKTEILSIPTICIGNATAGGAGKTPVAIAIAKKLLIDGKKIAFVSRGYGGKLRGPVMVDPLYHNAADVGDEPLLLSKIAPCWIAKKRLAGAKAAIASNAEIIIFDDGLQNTSIHYDITILVVDGGYAFGNGMLIPSGPLRETLKTTFLRSDMVTLLGHDTYHIRKWLESIFPVSHGILKASGNTKYEGKYFAFAGIGRPEKFFHTIKENGLDIIGEKSFGDHYKYRNRDIKHLIQIAKAENATLITTAKDAVRIPLKYHNDITIFSIEVEWKDDTEINTILKTLI